jgi:hypothetical protein
MKYGPISIILGIILVSTAISSNHLSLDRSKEIVVMTTSDLQSEVAPFSGSPGALPVGGLPRIAAVAKNISAQSNGSDNSMG